MRSYSSSNITKYEYMQYKNNKNIRIYAIQEYENIRIPEDKTILGIEEYKSIRI